MKPFIDGPMLALEIASMALDEPIPEDVAMLLSWMTLSCRQCGQSAAIRALSLTIVTFEATGEIQVRAQAEDDLCEACAETALADRVASRDFYMLKAAAVDVNNPASELALLIAQAQKLYVKGAVPTAFPLVINTAARQVNEHGYRLCGVRAATLSSGLVVVGAMSGFDLPTADCASVPIDALQQAELRQLDLQSVVVSRELLLALRDLPLRALRLDTLRPCVDVNFLDMIANSDLGESLRELKLVGRTFAALPPDEPHRGVGWLALPRLAKLNVAGAMSIGQDHAGLATLAALTRLTALRLEDVNAGDVLRALANAAPSLPLRQLCLCGRGLDVDEVTALGFAAAAGELETLCLSVSCPIPDVVALAFVRPRSVKYVNMNFVNENAALVVMRSVGDKKMTLRLAPQRNWHVSWVHNLSFRARANECLEASPGLTLNMEPWPQGKGTKPGCCPVCRFH